MKEVERMRYPKIYYQTMMLKKMWSKSKDPDREMMIQIFDETLEAIADQYPVFFADEIEELDETG